MSPNPDKDLPKFNSEGQELIVRSLAHAQGVEGQLRLADVLREGANLFDAASKLFSQTPADKERKKHELGYKMLEICTDSRKLNDHCQLRIKSYHPSLTPPEIEHVLNEGLASLKYEQLIQLSDDDNALRTIHRELMYLDHAQKYHSSWQQAIIDAFASEEFRPAA